MTATEAPVRAASWPAARADLSPEDRAESAVNHGTGRGDPLVGGDGEAFSLSAAFPALEPSSSSEALGVGVGSSRLTPFFFFNNLIALFFLN